MTDKQQFILTTALKLFYTKGVHAVGINEILKETGIAKKTMYRYYASKELLIVAALEYRDAQFMRWLSGRMERVEAGEAALLEVFHALDDWFNGRVETLGEYYGCFFINVSAEYNDPASEIFKCCKRHKQQVVFLLQKHTRVLCGDDVIAEQLARTLSLLKEGAIATAQVQEDKQAAIVLIPTVEALVAMHGCKKN